MIDWKRIAPALLALAVTMAAAKGDWRFDAETGGFYDSNLSRSDRARDEEPDGAWQSNVRLENGFQLARDLRLNLEIDLRGQVWTQYDAFDNIGPGALVGLRYRFGLGPSAPWLLVDNRLGYDFFHEGDRSGWDERFRVRGGLRITDRLSLEVGYVFENFAAPGRFFDLAGNTGSVQLAFDVTSSLQIALGYAYREGDVISYAIPPRPDIVALASRLQTVHSFDEPYTGYRLDASTNTFSISAGYALNKFFSIQVWYAYAATSRHPLEYENHLVEAKVAVAF